MQGKHWLCGGWSTGQDFCFQYFHLYKYTLKFFTDAQLNRGCTTWSSCNTMNWLAVKQKNMYVWNMAERGRVLQRLHGSSSPKNAKHTKSEAIKQSLLADRIIRGLKAGSCNSWQYLQTHLLAHYISLCVQYFLYWLDHYFKMADAKPQP